MVFFAEELDAETQKLPTETHLCYAVPVNIGFIWSSCLVGGYGGYTGRVRVCPGFISLYPYPGPRGYRPVPVAGLPDPWHALILCVAWKARG